MGRKAAHYLALVALLVQGVLGSVAPAAALCLHFGACNLPVETGAEDDDCSKGVCCSREHDAESTEARSTLALTVPCDDDCDDCVDISLPDVEMVLVKPESAGAEVPATALPIAFAVLDLEGALRRPLVQAVGPPEGHACLHRLVISSTRLLI